MLSKRLWSSSSLISSTSSPSSLLIRTTSPRTINHKFFTGRLSTKSKGPQLIPITKNTPSTQNQAKKTSYHTMATPNPRILLVGGHGKISLLATPQILERGWHLTSVIRNPDQKNDILAAAAKAKSGKENIEVLVHSIEDIKSMDDAKKLLDLSKPDWVLFSAGSSSAFLLCAS